MKNCPRCKSKRIIRADKERETYFCEDCELFFDPVLLGGEND